MIIHDFNVKCVAIFKAETYAPLIVDAEYAIVRCGYVFDHVRLIRPTWTEFHFSQPDLPIRIKPARLSEPRSTAYPGLASAIACPKRGFLC